MRFPQYRVTRFNLWTDPVNPWKESHRLPVHEGGLLAELLYADQPQVIEDLTLDADDPANAYLAGQRSLLAIPHFDQGTAQNMVILAREDADAFPRDRIADLVLLGNLFARATQTLVLSQAVKEAYDAVDYELRTIADIQKSLLPAVDAEGPGAGRRGPLPDREARRRRLLRLLPAPGRPARRADRRRQRARRAGRGADGGRAQHRPHAARTA